MIRQEQIEKAAKKYVKDIITPLPASLMTAFMQGAEWADANPNNPYKDVIEHMSSNTYRVWLNKACGWLKANHDEIFLRYMRGYGADDEIEIFKNIMEGKQ